MSNKEIQSLQGKKLYTLQRYEAWIPVEEYMEEYVDIPTFLERCKECRNYGRLWSCPPYDFNVEKHWRQNNTLYVLGMKITFEPWVLEQEYNQEELDELLKSVLTAEKQKLAEELLWKEDQVPGSMSLSAGSCGLCDTESCGRIYGRECCHPDEMRYSLESLGANVGKTASQLLGIPLEWMTEGKLPPYFTLVSGLLY